VNLNLVNTGGFDHITGELDLVTGGLTTSLVDLNTEGV
jgi:hypothetical protein